jgi:hypothetical protein
VVGSDNFRDNSSIYRLMQKTQLQQLSSLLWCFWHYCFLQCCREFCCY